MESSVQESGTRSHRGIGFITFEDPGKCLNIMSVLYKEVASILSVLTQYNSSPVLESVSKVMAQTHEIGGSTVAVDEATAKVTVLNHED